MNTRALNYISVHQATGGKKVKVLDPETEMRLNHFRRHFKGLGAEVGATPP